MREGTKKNSTEISHRGLQKYDDQHDTAPNCLAQGLQIEPRFGASRDGTSAVLCGVRAVAGCSISLQDRAAGAGALPKRYCCLGGPPERRLLSQGECVIWPYGCKPLRLPRRSRPDRHARNAELTLPPETKRGDGRLWSRGPVGSTNRLSSDRLDWCDNTLCRFNDLAGIETQILSEARRQDLRAPASELHDCRSALRGRERRARARLGWRGWNPAGALLPPLLYRDVRRRRVAEHGLNVSTGSIAPLHAHCKRVRSRTRIRPSDPLV